MIFGFKKKTTQEALKETIVAALKEIYDPEIPVNIYDLGLIYDVSVDEQLAVHIQMTLTTPMCPVAQTFPQTVEQKILTIPEITHVSVELVWDPPWTQDMMSEAAKLELGLF